MLSWLPILGLLSHAHHAVDTFHEDQWTVVQRERERERGGGGGGGHSGPATARVSPLKPGWLIGVS